MDVKESQNGKGAEQKSPRKAKGYQRKKEKYNFEDVLIHTISKPKITKSVEENCKIHEKEVSAQVKALYNHYDLDFDPLINGHRLAICLAKEFISHFLEEDYHIGRPPKDTFSRQLAICTAFEILRLEHIPENPSITLLAKEAQKRWNLNQSEKSLRVRYQEIVKTNNYHLFQKLFSTNKSKEEQLVYLNSILEDLLNGISI